MPLNTLQDNALNHGLIVTSASPFASMKSLFSSESAFSIDEGRGRCSAVLYIAYMAEEKKKVRMVEKKEKKVEEEKKKKMGNVNWVKRVKNVGIGTKLSVV